ncbi:MAG: hypothetical protein ABI175_13030, partial [Polyangiales bacterium]
HYLVLETRWATTAYWTSIALIVIAVLVPRLLPCTDYPQHLALADIARRLSDPSAPERASYSVNFFTYNGLFHVLVAGLGRVLPIELAGRLVVAGSLGLLGAGVLALVRVLGRPGSHAALFVPIIFSFAVGWGFVNYALGTAIAFVTLALVARNLQRPTWQRALTIGFLGLVCGMTHVLAMLILCLLAAAIAPETAHRALREAPLSVRRLGAIFVRATVALAPLLVGCVWCIVIYRIQYAWDPVMYKDPTLEGSSPPVWQKLVFFGAWGTGIHTDFTDQVLLVAGLVVAATAAVLRLRRKAEPGETAPYLLPLIVALAAYLVTPMVFIGTHLIFPRLAQAVVLGIVLATPAFPRVRAVTFSRLSLAIGVLAGANLLAHMVAYASETDDAARVIDEAPEGRKATAVVYDSQTFSFRNGTLVHLAAYYAAIKHGDWSFAFARYLSVPVRYTASGAPPWPKLGWEFSPWDYNPRCRYARNFDLVFVKAPPDLDTSDAGEAAVRKLVFKIDAEAVRLVSHHGHYWAFDTKGLPDDGTY